MAVLGGGGDSMGSVLVEMWCCGVCGTNSFATRARCFTCTAAKPVRPKLVLEIWAKAALLAKKGGPGREEQREEGGKKGKGKGGRMADGKGNGPKGEAQGRQEERRQGNKGLQSEQGVRVEEAGEEMDGGLYGGSGEQGESWAQVVAGRRKKFPGTRPKAAAAPVGARAEGSKEGKEKDEGNEGKQEEDYREMQPVYVPPLPRPILEGRLQELQGKAQELETDEQGSRKHERVKARLEETQEAYRAAGGGKGMRGYFSLLNSRKKISRLEKLQQEAHQEIDDADEMQLRADERKKQALARAESVTRELDNERSKHAYMALQSAQEAGRHVHGFGVRTAVEGLRKVLQETRRMDGVPFLDAIDVLVNHLEPTPYEGAIDPIILGLEVSDSSATDEDADKEGNSGTEGQDLSDSSGGGDMEGVEENRRGTKRDHDAWDDRWESAEQRENGRRNNQVAQPGVASGGGLQEELREETKKLEEDLKRSKGFLEHTIEANRQIEEQERLQLQQDKESAVLQAAMEIEARVQGQAINRWTGGAAKVPSSNPRLDINATRQRAEMSGGRPSKGSGVPTFEDQNNGGSTKGHRKDDRSQSRSPRGRLLDGID